MSAPEKTIFPEEFVKKYKDLLGEEWKIFFDTIQVKQPKSFWINTNKTSVPEVQKSLSSKEVKFEKYPFDEIKVKL